MLLLLDAHGLTFCSVIIAGAGCAAIFPTAIARLSHRLTGHSGTTLGFVFASAGLGAAVLPFGVGALSSATQNLRIGMTLLFVAEIALLVAHLWMSHLATRTTANVDLDKRRTIATSG